MKISKDKLKQIVREELESLTALSERKVKGKAVGNFLKKGRAGRTLTMQGKEYTDLGKGKWKGPDNKKLDWIELSSMASALGDEMVTLDEQKISENRNKFFIVDPTGKRGEPAYYRRKSTNDDSAFEFSTLFGATGFDSKGSANTTMKRIKSSSSKYRRATLKVLRGDQLHEDISEAKVSPADKKQFQSDAQEILDNMEKANLVDKDTEFHVVKNSLRHVFSAIANGEGNANYNKVKKYMPKKLNNDLYDNGEKNSYDSVWFSMNDAQRETIFLKAIRAKKLNLSEDSINEDQYGDVSFSRRKLKLASEDAECIKHCLADKAENEELPNWWKDKISKAADYLNICRDYIKTNNVNDLGGVHEDTEKEYPIWGIPPGKNSEELLYTRATSHSQAKKIAKVLTDKHGCKKVRIQVLDLAQDPADIFKSDKLFNK